MMRTLSIVIFAVIALATAGTAASAQSCTATISASNFGTVELLTGGSFDTTATLSLFCSGAPGEVVRVCPSIGAGSGGSSNGGATRTMTTTPSGQLGFNLYQDPGHQFVWGAVDGSMGGFGPPAIDITMNAGGAGNETATIYGRIFSAQQSAPIGSYASTFSAGSVSIASDYAAGNPTCAAIGVNNAYQTAFNAEAQYFASCTVSATAMSFGSIAATQAGATDSSATISMQCSNSAPYNVLLNGGLTGAANPLARKMQSGANLLTYALYKDSNRTQPWGETIGSNVLGGTGTGGNQSIAVYGRVPQQATPPTGSYADTVIVTIDY